MYVEIRRRVLLWFTVDYVLCVCPVCVYMSVHEYSCKHAYMCLYLCMYVCACVLMFMCAVCT
jgi:hypothetical protein